MKMQNADMEFVTFDAQDVIATSGGFSLNAASTYRFFGFTDKEAKNGYIQETTKDNITYIWKMFDKDGNLATLPENLSIKTGIYAKGRSQTGSTIGTFQSWDTAGNPVAEAYGTVVFQWVENYFVKQ